MASVTKGCEERGSWESRRTPVRKRSTTVSGSTRRVSSQPKEGDKPLSKQDGPQKNPNHQLHLSHGTRGTAFRTGRVALPGGEEDSKLPQENSVGTSISWYETMAGPNIAAQMNVKGVKPISKQSSPFSLGAYIQTWQTLFVGVQSPPMVPQGFRP